MTTQDTRDDATDSDGRGPVLDYQMMGPVAPPLHYFERMDKAQQQARPVFRAHDVTDYYVFTDYAAILEGLQHPEWFSSSVIVPTEPDPPYKWIPIMLDPPDHTKWRRLLGAWFSPGRVEGMADEQRAFAAELIDGVKDKGSCEFMDEFAQVFPTTIFLRIMGMPAEELHRFMDWEHKILHGTPESDPDRSVAIGAMMDVMSYFGQLIATRRADPSQRGDDIVSAALDWEIDGEPVQDQDVLSCCLLLFMAGLDTVAAQLSYTLLHLARNPQDRQRLLDDLGKTDAVVEESLRTYSIVQTARKATQDMDFHGCPVKAGDMVAFPLSAACRDETFLPNAKQFDLDRGPTKHIAFGAGPHRCLGSNLARQELRIALEEWHKRIPDYRVADESAVIEHAGGVFSLDRLPLEWNV